MYEFYNRDKDIRIEFETRKELFAYLKRLCGRWRCEFSSVDELLQRVALNDNDEYLDVKVQFADIISVKKEYKRRPIMVKEDGRIIDVRLFKKEIEEANIDDYTFPAKHMGVGHGNDGYTHDDYGIRRKYRHMLREDAANEMLTKEYGFAPRPSNIRKFEFRDSTWNYTRSWKNQTKSRKQWGRHSVEPVKRFTKNQYPEEAYQSDIYEMEDAEL